MAPVALVRPIKETVQERAPERVCFPFAAIVGQDPKPLPPAIPAPVAALIGRCLARERSDRYQTARELKTVIETVRTAPCSLSLQLV